INIIGGFIIGIAQHDMTLADAMHNYTLLTIGDGLVAQIPSLLLSTAVAIIVTRVSKAQDLGDQVMWQLFGEPRALAIAGGILFLLGVIPGMPSLAFLSLAAVCGGGAFMVMRKRAQPAPVEEEVEAPAASPESSELGWDDVTQMDIIGLEVGYRLIPLVDRKHGGELMSRIKGVRRKLSQQMGFLVQPVHIRDNLELAPSAYRISLMGVPVAEAEVHPERELAINPGQVFGTLSGIDTKDPAFGLDAVWIEPASREHAQTLGYTVVDCGTVVATHMSRVLQDHAHELLGHEEAQQLLDALARTAPRLVEDLVPKALPMSTVVKVLQTLLAERVSIKNLRKIVETLADCAPRSQDPDALVAQVRISLARSIVQQINGMEPQLPVMTLDSELEQILQESMQTGPGSGPGFEPGLVERVHRSLMQRTQAQESQGEPSVLLVPPALRSWFARLTRHSLPNLNVLSYNEVPDDKQIRMVATVGSA
ncbi:MAG: flagellar biosynthesis protein FlhA, partial [Pseudomonadota bacterium]